MDRSESFSCGSHKQRRKTSQESSQSSSSSEEENQEEEEESTSSSSGEEKELSLRAWLDKPGRHVDRLESLHVFRQVAEALLLAHSQGVVVSNARPSCFLLSALSRVSFIESGSGEDSGEEITGRRPERAEFPMKRILGMEYGWYLSPEEMEGKGGGFESDVYRLGVLLFELFCTFDSFEEKMGMMANLRHRVLHPQLLLKWPKEASFCLWLLHPKPESRPKMSEVLQSEFLNQSRNSLEEREAVVRLREEIDDQELLLEFLTQLQKEKLETETKLKQTISFLSSDIDEVSTKQTLINNDHNNNGNDSNNNAEFPASNKRIRPEMNPIINLQDQDQIVISKSTRLMKNFKKLESVYFTARSRLSKNTYRTEGSSVENNSNSNPNFCEKSRKEWMNPFLESLCKYLSYSKLKVLGEVKQGDLLSSSNLVCSLGFDRDKELFATAGVNKKIKIFECNVILNEERDIHYPLIEMVNRSKLSCISWNGYMKSQIASSDFEGIVQVWDVTRGQVFAEMREHERRVWSVDFSLVDPTRLASASDDGSVKIWHINQPGSVGTIRTKANLCSVSFHPDSSRHLAVGSADHFLYYYDLRSLRGPVCTFSGHAKTVSYVRFMDAGTLVSASTDGTVKLWEVGRGERVVEGASQTFTGHVNTKNFVGLSISDGYIATGSETNEVFVYHKGFPMPVLSHKFSITDPITGQEIDDPSQFISSLCWRGSTNTLLAANSSGNIKLFEMD